MQMCSSPGLFVCKPKVFTREGWGSIFNKIFEENQFTQQSKHVNGFMNEGNTSEGHHIILSIFPIFLYVFPSTELKHSRFKSEEI